MEAVTGLSKGSPVQRNGINVGDVIQLKLYPLDPRNVLAHIRLAGDTPIQQDTHAERLLTGLTGITNIQLNGGSPDSPPLTDERGRLPLIVAGLSPLAKLLANGEDLITSINEAVARANQLLSDQNVEHIANMLASLQRATANIDQLLNVNHDALDTGLRGVDKMAPAMNELRKTLDSLQSISRKLDDKPASCLLGGEHTKEFKP
jgi:ABC-type transporter Mla subunit MlaD